MTKLTELMQKLCPNGMEYKELREMFYIKKGIQFNKFSLAVFYELKNQKDDMVNCSIDTTQN